VAWYKEFSIIYINPRICSSHLLRLENPCCNACFTILLLNISTDMPSLQNRSNFTFLCGFLRLATTATAKSGIMSETFVWGFVVQKYYNLAKFLNSLPKRQNEITITFEEVEMLIDNKLPFSARKYASWWANDPTHSQARYWLDAGWKTRDVDIENQEVTFYSDVKWN